MALRDGALAVTARERASDDGLLLVYSTGRGPDRELRLGDGIATPAVLAGFVLRTGDGAEVPLSAVAGRRSGSTSLPRRPPTNGALPAGRRPRRERP